MNFKILALLSTLFATISTPLAAETIYEQRQVRALLTPTQHATLSAPMSERIKSILVEESDSFKQGDPLVIFECDILHAEERQAEAELEIKRRTHETNILMQEMQSISGLEVAISSARIKQASAALEKVRTEVKRCTLKAPFAGRVTLRHIEPFESVKRGEKIIEIVDSRNLQIELHIPSTWLQWLKVGSNFKLKVDETSKTVDATVTMIGAKINPVSQTIKIRGSLNTRTSELLPGMSGSAHF